MRRSVGFLIDRWAPGRGGAEACLAQLARHLERRGQRVLVFAEEFERGAPGEPRPVPRSSGLGRLLRARRERALGESLVAAARESACDVTIGIRHLSAVDLYWPHGGLYLRSLEARDASRGRAPRSDHVPGGRHRVYLDFERELLDEGGGRRIVCVSKLVRDELIEHHPKCRDRLELVPNGVDLDRFRPENRAGVGAELRAELGLAPSTAGHRGAPLLAFAARDPLLKGLPQLFDALSALTARPWTLLVAGVRHPERWQRLAARSGLDPERVRVRAHVRAPALFSAADVVCHPTWRDTSALVLLEALASGTPVVTTERAGEAALVARCRGGTVLEDPADVEGLRAALDSWLVRAERDELPPPRDLRAAVSDRGLVPWLERLERILEDLVREKQDVRGSV